MATFNTNTLCYEGCTRDLYCKCCEIYLDTLSFDDFDYYSPTSPTSPTYPTTPTTPTTPSEEGVNLDTKVYGVTRLELDVMSISNMLKDNIINITAIMNIFGLTSFVVDRSVTAEATNRVGQY